MRRLVKVKNVSADVSERQALSNSTRFSGSRDPIMNYDSLSTLMSPVDVGANLAGLEHCRDVQLFPISGWERSENRLKRLLSCVGMSKLLEWLLSGLSSKPKKAGFKITPFRDLPKKFLATTREMQTVRRRAAAERVSSLLTWSGLLCGIQFWVPPVYC